jgi:hypothetical protein
LSSVGRATPDVRAAVRPSTTKHPRENVSIEVSPKISGTSIFSYKHLHLKPSARLLCLLAPPYAVTAIIRTTRQEAIRWHLLFSEPPRTGVADSLARSKASESTLNAAVPACSKGAEVYSISYAIRCARPDLKIRLCALDISKDMLEFAEAGVHSLRSHDGSGAPGPGFLPLGRSSPRKTSARRSTKVNLWRWSRPHPHKA